MRRPIIRVLTARLVLGIALGLTPIAGHSLSLGKLKVQSGLNEPLRAEIDFTSIADNERRGLNVTLAPRADFIAAGAERLPFLSQIKFQVVQRPDGRYFLELKSDQPIEEPFLHMLLQVEWAGGRLVREYTALIDPPSFMVSKPAMVEAPSTASSVPPTLAPKPTETAPSGSVQTVPPPTTDATPAPQVGTAPQVASAPAPEKPAEPMLKQEPISVATPEPAAAATETEPPIPPAYIPPAEFTQLQPEQPVEPGPAATAMAGGTTAALEYRVQSGDNLWSIAERMRDDKQMTMEQVIVAIFKNNRDAFYRDNVNNLRAGKVLKIPERETIAQTAATDARREFKVQYDAWQEYKLKLAAGSRTLKVGDSAALPVETGTAVAAPTKASEGQTAKSAAKPADEMLKIVRNPDAKASPGKGAEAPKDVEKGERAALANRATLLEESIESKQLENRELSEKIGQVRAQIKNEKRLMELENQALAKQTQPKAEVPKVEAKPAAKPIEAAKPAEAPKPAEAVKQTEIAAAPKAQAEVVKPAVKPASPKPVVPVAVPEEKNFFAALIDDVSFDSTLPLVGGVLVLGGGIILIIYLRRRQRSIAEFEESILASDAIATENPAAPGASNTTGQAATTGDTSFLSDFSKAGMGHMQTDEVDPIAEAEVYLAYGRDETAEEILKEAIVKNPDRQELKQKLLEIYHQRNDANAFETLAEELYASLGGRGGKMWEKVEEMGRKLNPDNPMFRGGAPVPVGRRTTDKVERTAVAGAGAAAMAPTMMADFGASSASAPTQVVDGGIDFNASVSAADSVEPSFDFDLNDAARSMKPESAKADDLGSIDFGDLATPDAGSDNVINFESSKPEPAAASADDEIKWELDASVLETAISESAPANADGGAQEAHWDETATKLDLAKAYIDMGDGDGARSILDEVLAEGNDQQKRQAAELASQIA